MFSIFKKNAKEGDVRRELFDFLAEIEKNLEFFYVMDQRQFITHGYLIEVWPRVKNLDSIKRHEGIVIYVKAMQDFNQSLKTYKEYEAWYTKDANNKTPENSKKLHALKHDTDHRLKNMEAIIITAGQDLEKEMLQLGMLKQ